MVDIGLVDIDDICVQCATALAASGDFATVEAVQRRALADVSERFAPTAAAAAITAIRMARALPSLMQLAEIQHRLETFTHFADFVLGEEVAGATRGDGARAPWAAILETELAVRQGWWDAWRKGADMEDDDAMVS